MKSIQRLLTTGIGLSILQVLLVTLPACTPEVQAPPPPKPPMVEVSQATGSELTQYFRYNGLMRSVDEVEIRARVRGYIEKIVFKPSTNVKAGDLLFIIEQAQFQAAVNRARGRLEQAEARLKLAEVTAARIERAFGERAASEDEFSTAKAEVEQRRGEVLEAQADLDDAHIELGYTEIRSPLDGRIDDARVDVGDLVGASEPTLLCTIVQMDPIHAYFDVSERIALQYLGRGEDGNAEKEFPPAFLGLANEDGYPHEGVVDYVDNVLDSSTGTLTVRGLFDNSDRRLYPGLYARIRVPFEESPDAVMIQESGIATGLEGRYVLTLNDKNIVTRTPVTLGERADSGFVQVTKGLSIGDRYIVNGLQFARPGMPVRVKTDALPVSNPTDPVAAPEEYADSEAQLKADG